MPAGKSYAKTLTIPRGIAMSHHELVEHKAAMWLYLYLLDKSEVGLREVATRVAVSLCEGEDPCRALLSCGAVQQAGSHLRVNASFGGLEAVSSRKAKANRPPIRHRTRFAVLERDGFRCVYCGATADSSRLEVDHVVPVAHGGAHELSNLVTACFECNAGKSDRLLGGA